MTQQNTWKTCILKTLNYWICHVNELDTKYCSNVKLLQIIVKINAIPVRFGGDSFIDMDKLILKYIWKCRASRQSKAIL